MRLKSKNTNKIILEDLITRFSRLKKNKKIILGIILLCLFTVATLYCGAILYKTKFLSKVKGAVLLNYQIIPRYIAGLLSNPEHITIDIKQEDFQKLAQQREESLVKGILVKSLDNDNDYVPATIRYQDKTIKVKLRLKGDLADHWTGDKWSFRIKVKGDDTLFGMKYLSIQDPNTRNYLYEWILHQTLKKENLISLRYEFIDVTLNGKHLGIYAMEEHFDRLLVENNQRREGPILQLNEDLTWQEIIRDYDFPAEQALIRSESVGYLESNFDSYQTNRILKIPEQYEYFKKAVSLFESFREGKLKTSDVFDVPQLATYFAIIDLLGGQHGINWSNSIFYYNPITARLEPIGFDGSGSPTEQSGLSPLYPDQSIYILSDPKEVFGKKDISEYFRTITFSDEKFFRQYIKELERLSEESYLNNLLVELHNDLQRNLSILYKDCLFDYWTSEQAISDVLHSNQRYIQRMLNPVKGFQAHFNNISGNLITIELGNIQSIPIEILNISYKDSLLLQPVKKIILPPKISSEPVNYQDVSFVLPENLIWSENIIPNLKINYKLLGAGEERQENIFPWSHLDSNFIKNDITRQQSNIYKFQFLVKDESTKTILIKPGTWTINQNLIIPKGYRVLANSGVHLNLSNQAKILSYSPLEFKGTERLPIYISSSDSTGQGIAVINADQKSTLEYVVFDNLSNPSQSGWELTGAVIFYKSPVVISSSQFSNNRSEDCLNIIHSEFAINNTAFSKTSMDAFDSDFSKGEITNSSFTNCGNDCIDVSGSVVELQHIIINGAGDKGISAGEESQINASQIEIKNSFLGAASKDISNLTIKNIVMLNTEIGFAVYQKKPEYGPAQMSIDALKKEKIKDLYLLESNSKLTIDGSPQKANQENKNILEKLYGSKN